MDKNKKIQLRLANRAKYIADKVQLNNLNIPTEPVKLPVVKEHIVVTVPNKGLTLYTIHTYTDIKKIFSLLYRSDRKFIKNHIICLNNDVKYTKIVFTGRTYKIYTNLDINDTLSLIDRFNNLDKFFINSHIISDKKIICKISFNYTDMDTLDIY